MVLVAAGAVVVERVIVVMSSEQAAAKSAAKANDNPNSEKKLSLRRTMLILDIKPAHYKAYFLTAFFGSQNWEASPRDLSEKFAQRDLQRRFAKTFTEAWAAWGSNPAP